jgi:site-specific DNA-cytosine methylase
LGIGGSPCDDLSGINPNRRGLCDPGGTGKLFFFYSNIIRIIGDWNMEASSSEKQFKTFFPFENVRSMTINDRNVISQFLRTQPVLRQSDKISPQTRPRLFWSNLPWVTEPSLEEREKEMLA